MQWSIIFAQVAAQLSHLQCTVVNKAGDQDRRCYRKAQRSVKNLVVQEFLASSFNFIYINLAGQSQKLNSQTSFFQKRISATDHLKKQNLEVVIIMISKVTKSLIYQSRSLFGTAAFTPILYGNGKSIVSLSQWWNGTDARPSDYYVQDKLQAELCGEWKIQNGIFRVVFSANLSDPSMNININHLKKSTSLNQLIQLSAAEKEQLVENPSTVIIRPFFSLEHSECQNQIAKNMLQLDKLFEDGVGLKTAYLINAQALGVPSYLSEIKKRSKAVSSDVALAGQSLGNVLFDHGHRLQHVFYSSPFRSDVPAANFEEVLGAMSAVDFKGKLILSGGPNYNKEIEAFEAVAHKAGFSQKLQFSLETDGWYTMT